MIYLLLIISINTLFALPRFALEQGSSCVNCHVNPTGSGMRNDHGTNVYNLDELTIRKWISKGNEDWDGSITDHIQIGGEFRILSFEGNSESATFPMQADIYTKVDINKDVDFYFEKSLGSSTYDFFLLFNELPNNSWIKIGQSSINYGLIIDDHTAFIKSGNRKALHSDNKNLDKGFRDIFDPVAEKPLMFEWGMKLPNGLLMTIDFSQDIDNQHSKLVNYSTTLNYIKDYSDWSFMLGSSLMKEEDISLNGLFGGISVSKITMIFEVDKADNVIDNQSSIASYVQFVYKPIQGFHLISKYDYFDNDYDLKTGSIGRYTFGIELYPLNILEIKVQARKYEINNYIPLDLDLEYLLQIHTWF